MPRFRSKNASDAEAKMRAAGKCLGFRSKMHVGGGIAPDLEAKMHVDRKNAPDLESKMYVGGKNVAL